MRSLLLLEASRGNCMFPAIQVSPDDCNVRQLLPGTMEKGAQRAHQPSPSFDTEPSETLRLTFLFKSRLEQKYLHLLLKLCHHIAGTHICRGICMRSITEELSDGNLF